MTRKVGDRAAQWRAGRPGYGRGARVDVGDRPAVVRWHLANPDEWTWPANLDEAT